MFDLNKELVEDAADKLSQHIGRPSIGMAVDITDENALLKARDNLLSKFGRIDILINNAANNPKVESDQDNPETSHWSRLENIPLATWHRT